jgi:Na+-transporting methylmalonyl-CoA/oxaloacetate decarboxylase gamma subunit
VTFTTPPQLPDDVPTSRHLARRTFATILGGFGIVFLGLGIIALVLMSFVSSPIAAKSTVEIALQQPEVRNYLVEEIVNEIEEKANPVQKLVLTFARNKIVTAVQKVLAEPEIQSFAGDAAAKAYSVYVDNEPVAEIDISPISKAVVAAVIGTDKRLKFADNLELDPITITRDDNDLDFGPLRDSLQRSSSLFVILGILLQIAAWFLSVATLWQRVRRLGIRLFAGGVIFLGLVLFTRSRVPQSSTDNKPALEAAVSLITDPMVTRFVVLIVLGLITGLIGFVMNRKAQSTVSPVTAS